MTQITIEPPNTELKLRRCFQRTAVVDGENVTLGIFYADDDGVLHKVCTDDQCRQALDVPCSHVQLDFCEAVKIGDAVYLAGRAHSSDYTTFLHGFVLRLQDGASVWEKVLEVEMPVFRLYFSGGLLYTGAYPEMLAVDLEKQVYTRLEISDNDTVYGENGIAIVTPQGLYMVDTLLQPRRKLTERSWRGQISGTWYWYLLGETLYRVSLEGNSPPDLVMENVRQMVVCGDRLYYLSSSRSEGNILFYTRQTKRIQGELTVLDPLIPFMGREDGPLFCAEIRKNGTLGPAEVLYSVNDSYAENTSLGNSSMMDAFAGERQWFSWMSELCDLGDSFLFSIIRPGDEGFVQYFLDTYLVHEKGITLVSQYAQPAQEIGVK